MPGRIDDDLTLGQHIVCAGSCAPLQQGEHNDRAVDRYAEQAQRAHNRIEAQRQVEHPHPSEGEPHRQEPREQDQHGETERVEDQRHSTRHDDDERDRQRHEVCHRLAACFRFTAKQDVIAGRRLETGLLQSSLKTLKDGRGQRKGLGKAEDLVHPPPVEPRDNGGLRV